MFSHSGLLLPLQSAAPLPGHMVPNVVGPAFYPLSPLLTTPISHFRQYLFFAIKVAMSQVFSFTPQRPLPSFLPSGQYTHSKGSSAHTISQELAGRSSAFSCHFQKYDTPKIGDPCTLSQGPFLQAIFMSLCLSFY